MGVCVSIHRIMRDLTKHVWPYDASSEPDKIELLHMNVNPQVGNPTWDYNYMAKCVREWSEFADVEQEKDDEKKCDWLLADLKCMIEESFGYMASQHLHRLEKRLDVGKAVFEKIQQSHPKDTEAFTKAMFFAIEVPLPEHITHLYIPSLCPKVLNKREIEDEKARDQA